jgi:hypothetical protein
MCPKHDRITVLQVGLHCAGNDQDANAFNHSSQPVSSIRDIRAATSSSAVVQRHLHLRMPRIKIAAHGGHDDRP